MSPMKHPWGWSFTIIACMMLNGVNAQADRIVLVAGSGTRTDLAPATESKLNIPFGVDFDSQGQLYFVEMTGQRVARIDQEGMLHLVAGTGQAGYSGDGGPAILAQVNNLHNLSISPTGEIYLSDTWNQVVRQIDPRTGLITTIAGTGEKGYSGDGGPATKARFGGIYCVSIDPSGQRLYAVDLDNRRVRCVDLKSGRVDTVVGNGEKGVPVDDEMATGQPLVDPRAAIVDQEGTVFVLERGGHALRMVDPQGRIKTVVGTGQPGNSGDGGLARQATLNGPKHLCFDRDGSVLIADTDNHVIRRYDPRTGIITRVAGTGTAGKAGVGGPPLEIELSQPHGVTVSPSGDVYITDSYNHRLLKIEQEN